MANTYTFNCLMEDLGLGKHNFSNHQLRVYLTNSAPDSNNHTIKSDLAEITAANGYNNASISANWSRSGATATLAGTDVTWTATGGNFGPFRYIVLFNANSAGNLANCALIQWWDYGSSITCNNGENFTWDVPANGTIANFSVG